jgi:hypothetical protein
VSNKSKAATISTNSPSRKAPVPQVDKEHFRDTDKLQRNPKHIHNSLRNQ